MQVPAQPPGQNPWASSRDQDQCPRPCVPAGVPVWGRGLPLGPPSPKPAPDAQMPVTPSPLPTPPSFPFAHFSPMSPWLLETGFQAPPSPSGPP